jgi:hypothetical protein
MPISIDAKARIRAPANTQLNYGESKKFSGVGLVALVICAGGCVSTKNIPLDADAISKAKGGSIAATQREKPSFSAMTAGKAGFGLIGAVAMISAGNKIVTDNNVEDPALFIQKTLIGEFAQDNSLSIVQVDVPAESTDVKKLARQYAKTDILFDVQTINWSFAYFPSDWNNYRVIYSAKLRVIDTKRGKLLAEGFCARVPEKADDAPSHEELLANGAERLKRELLLGADHCVQELRAQVLKKS